MAHGPEPDRTKKSEPVAGSLGKYRLLRELGRGGMGVVFEAHDPELDRRVALKMMLASPNADPQEARLDEERFLREARLSANLAKHPHIVSVYEAGTVDGRRFIAMEHVDGRPMSKWRKAGSVTIRQQVRILRDVALAVHHAHGHGIIHRDLKPDNILIDPHGRPHVTDFGLAKTVGQDVSVSLTASGMIIGTPGYMSPEQARGLRSIDHHTDIYSMGVMLYEILTGRLPFTGETAIEILMKAVKNAPPRPSAVLKGGPGAAVDPTVEDICLKSLAKSPKDRYPSAEAFAQDLTAWLNGEKVHVSAPTRRTTAPLRRSRTLATVSAGAAVLVVAVGLFFAFSRPSVETELARARQFMELKNYTEALVAYGQAVAKDPSNPEARAGEEEARAAVDRARRESEAKDLEMERLKRALASKETAPSPAPPKKPAAEPAPAPPPPPQKPVAEPVRALQLPALIPWPEAVDLLALVDPARDAVYGSWKRESDGRLVSDATAHPTQGAARLEIPYRLPEEYDLRAVFTRLAGSESVDFVLVQGSNPFLWRLGAFQNSVFGFDLVAGKLAKDNPTGRRLPAGLQNGQPTITIVEVRKTGVKAFLGGGLLCQWQTDGSDLSLHSSWKLRSSGAVGLASWGSPTAFHRVEIRPVGSKREPVAGPPEPAPSKPEPLPVPAFDLAAESTKALGALWKALMAGKTALARHPVPLQKQGIQGATYAVRDLTEKELVLDMTFSGSTAQINEKVEALPAPVLLALLQKSSRTPAPELLQAAAVVCARQGLFDDAYKQLDLAARGGAKSDALVRGFAGAELARIDTLKTASERTAALKKTAAARAAAWPKDLNDAVARRLAGADQAARFAAGPLGWRTGDRPALLARGGGTQATEDAVLAALGWLARHQSTDGSWSVQGYVKQCRKTGGICQPNPGHDGFDGGVTGLATLAFLGAGHTEVSKEAADGVVFGDVVRKALAWMAANQDPEGCVGGRNLQKHLYNHSICAAALAGAAGMTGSEELRGRAQKAIDFIVAAQNPGKAWRYSYKCGDNDTSVLGWCVTALKGAEAVGLDFPKSAYDGAISFLDSVTEEAYGRAGYTHKGTGKVFVPGLNENFDHHEALTAAAIAARIFISRNRTDPRIVSGADLLKRDLPKWEGNSIDYYYWYYGSVALFQLDGPAGPRWRAWNEALKVALVPNQVAAGIGCKSGSWETVDRWAGEGGRVYGTAINALSLESYYRYAPSTR